MFVIIWTYVVRPDAVDEFRAAYGANGEWARLFGRSPAFMGVELIAVHPPGIHVTIDRWESEEAADAFMEALGDEYRQLDQRLERLTESEQLVVRGNSVDEPTPGWRAGP